MPGHRSCTQWDTGTILCWCKHVLRCLQATPDTDPSVLARWLRDTAVWRAVGYTSWHMLHAPPCQNLCADWSYEYPVLRNLALGAPVHLGPEGWGGGGGQHTFLWYSMQMMLVQDAGCAGRCSVSVPCTPLLDA